MVLKRFPYKEEITGSTPVSSTIADIAQRLVLDLAKVEMQVRFLLSAHLLPLSAMVARQILVLKVQVRVL